LLLIGTTAALTLLVTGSVAKGYGAEPRDESAKPPVSDIAPLVRTIAPPKTPLVAPATAPLAAAATALDGLQARAAQAGNEAAAHGAKISVAVLDRVTQQLVSTGDDQLVGIASVAKLFIADELLFQVSQGKAQLSQQDRRALELMLRSSDDDAAENFWYQLGGPTIITEVASRYGLALTTPPGDGRWWNTISSPSDLIRYYNMLLAGSGGLSTRQADIIITALAASTPTGVDGYPQRFGIPDGLRAQPVAVKQGWMCCIGSSWMHLSTGVVGADRRYIMVIESLQPSDDATARATITQAVKTLFPDGRIDGRT
jgi:hypothetical protein